MVVYRQSRVTIPKTDLLDALSSQKGWRCKCVDSLRLIAAKEFTTTAKDGTRCKLPIVPCGGWGFWLYLVLQLVTDTDTCEFIGLTPCFECALKWYQYCVKYCESVSRTHREDALLREAHQNKITRVSLYEGVQLTLDLMFWWDVATCWRWKSKTSWKWWND